MRRWPLLLVLGGTVGIVLLLGKVHSVSNDYPYTGTARFGWTLAYIVVLCIAAYGLGLPEAARSHREGFLLGIGAAALAAGVISLIQLFLGDALLPRFVVFTSAIVLAPWYAVCSGAARSGRARAETRDRVVVAADRMEAKALREDLGDKPERPAHLVDVIRIDASRSIDPATQPLFERVIRDRASVLVLSRQAQLDDSIVAQAAAVHAAGIRVRSLTAFYEEWLGKLPVYELERVSLMFDISEIHRRRYQRIKRIFDVGVASIGLVTLAVATPFVLMGNLLANRGALLYRQERVGKRGDRFNMLKFRTMRPIGDSLLNEWTSENDPRITSFGRLLRRTHIDELPQVINVLRGDLSIVGPRPEQPNYVAWLVERMPYYDLRHQVRPGATGWAQVKYGYAGSEVDALEKLQYDFYYLRYQGLALDLRIIGRTLRAVLGLGGR